MGVFFGEQWHTLQRKAFPCTWPLGIMQTIVVRRVVLNKKKKLKSTWVSLCLEADHPFLSYVQDKQPVKLMLCDLTPLLKKKNPCSWFAKITGLIMWVLWISPLSALDNLMFLKWYWPAGYAFNMHWLLHEPWFQESLTCNCTSKGFCPALNMQISAREWHHPEHCWQGQGLTEVLVTALGFIKFSSG